MQIPFDTYAKHAGISQSDCKTALESPAKFYEFKYRNGRAKQKPSAAMLDGIIDHAAILETERFFEDFIVCPPRNTKLGKERAAEIEKAGKTPITAAQAHNAGEIILRIGDNEIVSELLSTGEPEVSIFDKDQETGLEIKGRLDWLTGDGVIVDVKTVGEGKAGPHDFAKQIANFKYHMQAAHYMELAGAERFIFVAVERSYPYGVGVYELDAPALAEGAALRRKALRLIADCEQNGVWPGYTPEIKTLSLPSWGYDN